MFGSYFNADCEMSPVLHLLHRREFPCNSRYSGEQELGYRSAQRTILAQPVKRGNGRQGHEKEDTSTLQGTGFNPCPTERPGRSPICCRVEAGCPSLDHPYPPLTNRACTFPRTRLSPSPGYSCTRFRDSISTPHFSFLFSHRFR